MTSRALSLVKIAFFSAIAAALIWFGCSLDWSELSGVSVTWRWLALGTVLALLFRYLGVVIWLVVLVSIGETALPKFRIMADIYAKAWLARYIPGTVPWVAGKIYLAAEQGISKGRLAVSAIVEAAAQVVSIGAVSLVLLATDHRIAEVSPVLRWLVVISAVALLAAMMPAIFNRLLSLAMRVLKRHMQVTVTWSVVLRSLALYGLGAIISGTSYAFVAYSLDASLSFQDLVFLVGAFGLAGVVGILTPLAPSGLGTRDGTQLLLLLIVLPAPMAALVVLVSRVWSAAVDVLFWLIAAAMRNVLDIQIQLVK